jgi:hypothetical protein
MNTQHPVSARAPAQRARHIVIGAIAAACLAACGGDPDTPPVAQSISGTAAAGAPVVGTVTVKDSTGASRTSTIAADGSYKVDVTGMTGPFVFLADGKVGGRSIQMVSAATLADIDKTVNITPFTDLIVANMAGQVATTYFASPNFAKLSAAELDAARQTLTTRLLPILNALGVAAGFDLLRSSFAADHSGFDAVMDVVRVNTDPATLTATITDLVNNQQIQDNLASKADISALPAPVASLGDTVASLKGIEQSLANFSAQFANGVPAENDAVLRALVASDFLGGGGDAAWFLSAQAVLASWMVGVQQSGASIRSVSDGGATVDVEYLSKFKTVDYAGRTSDQWHMQFRRNANGVWQLAGDRHWAYVNLDSTNARFHNGGDNWTYSPNLSWWITSRSTRAQYALVSGPGFANWSPPALAGLSLPGVVLGRASGDSFQFYRASGAAGNSWVVDCSLPHPGDANCVDVAVVPNGAVYTVTMLDAQGAALGTPETVKLAGRPYTVAESSAAGNKWFPRIASTDPVTRAGLTNGKRITFALTRPTEAGYTLWSAGIAAPPTYYPQVDVMGTTADLGIWNGDPPTGSVEATVVARDALGRHFWSFYFLE